MDSGDGGLTPWLVVHVSELLEVSELRVPTWTGKTMAPCGSLEEARGRTRI